MVDENVEAALEYIARSTWKGSPLPRYGDLVVATDDERNSLEEKERLIAGYLADPKPKRPLCIAVFGAPGSGKSVSVNKIREKLEAEWKPRGLALSYLKLNLTQLTATEELAKSLHTLCDSVAKDGRVPVVFFDEFDAPLAGTPLGWLSWFLAPMEDGEFVHQGEAVKLARAVFVFAGGTAHRAADFGEQDPGRFRQAKGPDFVSRLRGSLDVFGPNDGDLSERCRRRALSIGFQLTEVLKTDAERGLLEALLRAGRYRHGNRSLAAVLELCARARGPAVGGATRALKIGDLPEDDLLSMHVDNGPLDASLIDGAIGMSCSFDDRSSSEAMRELAEELWRQGALIAFFRGHEVEDAFSWKPTTHAGMQPNPLSKRAFQALRAELFVFGDVDLSPRPGGDPSESVTVIRVPGHGRRAWKAEPKLAFEELARMRWIMNSRCVARVLARGRTETSPGRRVPGILEEAMFAVATKQPIYVLGGFGGAAQYLGGLLGLATCRRALPTIEYAKSKLPAEVATLGGALSLPQRGRDIPHYLTAFAIGGPSWPDNGLSVADNRKLFESTDTDEITDLVRRGLLRRFGQ